MTARVLVSALALLGLAVMATTACSQPQQAAAPQAALSPEAAAGRELFSTRACGACHRAPGIRDAVGTAGPTMAGFASRAKFAGTIDNTPENVRKWLVNPAALKPGAAMPALGLSDEDVTRLAAYLETLK